MRPCKPIIMFQALLVAAGLLLAADLLLAKDKKKVGDEKKDEPKWDVANPPGTWNVVPIDTQETTWSSVDVSPDGRTIVFDMLGDLYRVPIEGGEATALTNGIAWDFQPRYNPDGTRIAFVSDRDGAENIWLIDANGANPKQVSDEESDLVHNPYWSPDGDYIAAKKGFTSTRSIAAGEIWLFHAGGGGGLQLTERPNGPKDQKTMAEPAFSVDGRYVYYSQDTTAGRVWQYNKDATGQIFVIQRLDRSNGKIETHVAGPGGSIRPTPSPDGKHLAFVRRTPGAKSALYLKDLMTGREWPIYDKLDRDLQETNGSTGNTPAFAWTPDGRSLVFWAAGRIRRVDVQTKETAVIPVHVKTSRKVRTALRFPVEVAPQDVTVKMVRWAQMSPDGTHVLFEALGHLWIRDVAAGAARRLTGQNEHFEVWPSFSPDGNEIVYATWDDQDLGTLRVISVLGGQGRVVSREPGHYLEPRFSPDGRMLVYRKGTDGYVASGAWSNDPGIYIAPLSGGDPVRVSPSGFNPTFGPDGERIFFSDTFEETQLVFKSVDLRGNDERTHLKGSKVTEVSLSPDGRWIAFTEQFNAWVAPFTLTGRTVDLSTDMKSMPVAQVSGRSGEFMRWSFDSRKLHWANGATLYTRALSDAFAFLEGAPGELPKPVAEGLSLTFTVPADRPAGRIALTGARIVTMYDARKKQEVIEDGTVLVEGNRIAAVGQRDTVRIPEGTQIIDARGRTIIPGLIDVHAHGAQANNEIIPEQNWMQYSNLAFGITTIHDPSNDTSEIFAASELQKAGLIVAPRIFSTGTILYGADQPGYTARIKNLEEASFHVRRLKDVGAISVKSYNQPRRDQRQQVIEAAAALGVMVVPEGGAKFDYNMSQIVDGHTGIEHCIPLETAYDDVVQLWSGSGTGYTPTLGVAYGGLAGEVYWYDRTDVWLDQRLMRYSPHSIVEPDAIRRTKAPDSHYNHMNVARFAKELSEAGVSVQLGAHGQREGLASHWELWMMEQGGFSPWEALRAGTIDGARYLGMDKDIGSIEPGKLADLAIIDGNPLEDLHRSEYVVWTMINGRLYEATTMNQVAPEKVARQPFFFEKEGGDTIHPATQAWIERKSRAYGWAH